MEVIARKRGGLFGLYIFCAVFTLVLAAGGTVIIYFSDKHLANGIIILVFSLVAFAISFKIVNDIVKTPQIIITYENGKLRCGNTEFSPSQIVNVEYRRAHARGISYGWGRIKIILQNTTVTYDYVADVEQVHNRLIQLMLEKNKGE